MFLLNNLFGSFAAFEEAEMLCAGFFFLVGNLAVIALSEKLFLVVAVCYDCRKHHMFRSCLAISVMVPVSFAYNCQCLNLCVAVCLGCSHCGSAVCERGCGEALLQLCALLSVRL